MKNATLKSWAVSYGDLSVWLDRHSHTTAYTAHRRLLRLLAEDATVHVPGKGVCRVAQFVASIRETLERR